MITACSGSYLHINRTHLREIKEDHALVRQLVAQLRNVHADSLFTAQSARRAAGLLHRVCQALHRQFAAEEDAAYVAATNLPEDALEAAELAESAARFCREHEELHEAVCGLAKQAERMAAGKTKLDPDDLSRQIAGFCDRFVDHETREADMIIQRPELECS